MACQILREMVFHILSSHIIVSILNSTISHASKNFKVNLIYGIFNILYFIYPFVLGMDDSSYKLNLIQARIEEQNPYQHS
jgi:hypothetical protein